MTLVNGSIPSLINGVSQQAASVRLPTQAELQENAYSSVAHGLVKRPPSDFIAELDSNAVDTLVHFINRDEVERYVVLLKNGSVSIKDLSGNSIFVQTVGSPNTYITQAGLTPAKYLKAITLADTTFIVNTKKATAMQGTLSTGTLNEALVHVVQGNYATKYEIRLNGTAISHTTSATDILTLKTEAIATALHTALVAGFSAANWDFAIKDNTIHIKRDNGASFACEVADSNGSRNMKVVTTTVAKFSDLPGVAINDFVVEVQADKAAKTDDYYVKFVSQAASVPFANGVWRETIKPGIKYLLDPATMPHTLTRLQDDASGTVTGTPFAIYFKFSAATWTNRLVGSETTNPEPSFIGGTISDIFVHRDRLGFLSDTNVILSRQGDYFNFWRGSALTLLDDDPIDLEVPHPRVSILRHAVPFNQELILFSDRAQFSMKAGDLLTPKTASVTLCSEFECDPLCKPIVMENMIYFAFSNGVFAGVREFFTNEHDVKDADLITGHVPSYISGNVSKLAGSTTEDIVVALANTDDTISGSLVNRNFIYVYKYLWNGNQKVQSSWSKWVFRKEAGEVPLGVEFIDSYLYLVITKGAKLMLERINLDLEAVDPGPSNGVPANYLTHLDHRVAVPLLEQPTGSNYTVTVTYDSVTDETTYTMPYAVNPTNVRVVVKKWSQLGPQPGGGVDNGSPGVIWPVVFASGTTVKVKGRHDGAAAWIGEAYTMKYRFSPLILRSQSPLGGVVGVTAGRLQLRTLTVAFDKTTYFRFEVTPEFRSLSSYHYTAKILGSTLNLIGEVGVESGQKRVLIGSKNDQVTIDLVNDSPFPSRIVSAEWEGDYTTRARRL